MGGKCHPRFTAVSRHPAEAKKTDNCAKRPQNCPDVPCAQKSDCPLAPAHPAMRLPANNPARLPTSHRSPTAARRLPLTADCPPTTLRSLLVDSRVVHDPFLPCDICRGVHAGVRRLPAPSLSVSPVPRGSCYCLLSITSSNHLRVPLLSACLSVGPNPTSQLSQSPPLSWRSSPTE